MLDHLTRAVIRHHGKVVAAWLVVLAIGVAAAGPPFSSLDGDLDGPSSFPSEQVGRRLGALEERGGDVVAIVSGAPVAPAVLDALGALDGVATVHTMPSVDQAATGIAVTLDGGLTDEREEAVVGAVNAALRAIDAPEVLVGGELLLDEEVSALAEQDAQRAELISLPVALLVMAAVFGGVLVAGLPLSIALGGVTSAMVALALASKVLDISLYALNVTLMLGIGLGIDYGLLVVSRFREERGVGRDVPSAIRATMATAGRTVVFSACTVAVALVALLLFVDPTIRSLGLAGITVVLTTMGAALTLLPALLVTMGRRLRPATAASDHGWFGRLAGIIQRRAAAVVVIVGLGLLLLAAPVRNARFDDIGVHALPTSSETRRVAEAIDERFGAVPGEPVLVLADVDPASPDLARWLDLAQAVPGVAAVALDERSRPGLAVVEVEPAGPANGPKSQQVVRQLRALDAPFTVTVGGDPAEIVNLRDSVSSRLPWAVAVIVTATFVLLFLMTGSVVVPLKAIVMNVLSLGATFGALVWVFQDGHLAGVLGFDPPGSLDMVMPVVIFVFAFGLSMDYEVFLLARVREAWLASGDDDRAVAVGLQRSGRIITSAALLIVIVFAGFVAGDMVALKQLGLGLAIAVVVDATVVRLLLVPATMELMGRWNWWAPPMLARAHRRFGLDEGAPFEPLAETGPADAGQPAMLTDASRR